MSNPTLIPKPSSPLHKLFKPPKGRYFEQNTFKRNEEPLDQDHSIQKPSLNEETTQNENLKFEMVELEEQTPIESINQYEEDNFTIDLDNSINESKFITPVNPNKKRGKPTIKRKVIIEYIDAPEDESFYEVESDKDDEEYNPNKPKQKRSSRKRGMKDISFIDADIIDPTKIDPEELKRVPREVRSLIGPVEKLKSFSAEKPQAPSIIMEKVKKTKSGRLSVPPLEYWRGQYKRTDAFGNVIEITEGTPSVRPSNRKRHSLDSNVSGRKRKYIKNTEGKELNFDEVEEEKYYNEYESNYYKDIQFEHHEDILSESNFINVNSNENIDLNNNMNYEMKDDSFYKDLDTLIEEEEKELLTQDNLNSQPIHDQEILHNEKELIQNKEISSHSPTQSHLQQKEALDGQQVQRDNLHQSIHQKVSPKSISSQSSKENEIEEEFNQFSQNQELLKQDEEGVDHQIETELAQEDFLEPNQQTNPQQFLTPQNNNKFNNVKKETEPTLNRIEPLKIEQSTKTSIDNDEDDDSQDDIGLDNWDEEQLECLRKAINKYDPDDPKYWFKVSKHVPRKSAVECVQKYLGDLQKTKESSKIKKTKAKKMMSPLSIGDDMRLLKNRKKLRDLRKQKEENHQTDIFNSPSFSSKYESTLKMINEYESDDEDLYTKKILEATRDINEMVTSKKEESINNDDSIEDSSEESDYEYFLDSKNVDRDKYDKYLNRMKAPLKKTTKETNKKKSSTIHKKTKGDSSITKAIKIIRKLENQNEEKDLDEDEEESEESEDML